jgi:hypothetical protein
MRMIGAGAALALFREIYSHMFLPQPDIAKSGSFGNLNQGAHYLLTALPWWVSLPLVATAIARITACVRWRRGLGVVAATTLMLGARSIRFTRGDWMGGARPLVPYLPLYLALAIVSGMSLLPLVRHSTLAVVLEGELLLLVAFVNSSTRLSPTLAGATSAHPTQVAADVGAPLWSMWHWQDGTLPTLPWYLADNAI